MTGDDSQPGRSASHPLDRGGDAAGAGPGLPLPDTDDHEWFTVGMDERGRIHFLPDAEHAHEGASCCDTVGSFRWVADVRGEFLRAVTVYGVCANCVEARFGSGEQGTVHNNGFKFEFA